MKMKNKKLLFLLLVAVLALSCVLAVGFFRSDERKEIDSYTLYNQFNEFVREKKADGTLEEIYALWTGSDESKKVIDDSLTGENGTIRLATQCSSGEPMSYIKDGKRAGIDMHVAYLFAREYGYDIEISDYTSNNDVVAAVEAGKADMGCGGMSLTAERQQSVFFSDCYLSNKIVTVVSTAFAESYTGLESLNGKIIGVPYGFPFYEEVMAGAPETEIIEYATVADTALALAAGKVDAFIHDLPICQLLVNRYEGSVIVDYIKDDSLCFIFQKFGLQTAEDLEGKTIGVNEGTVFPELLSEYLTDYTPSYITTYADMIAALEGEKIDAFVADEAAALDLLEENPDSGLYILPESIGSSECGFIFPKPRRERSFPRRYPPLSCS